MEGCGDESAGAGEWAGLNGVAATLPGANGTAYAIAVATP